MHSDQPAAPLFLEALRKDYFFWTLFSAFVLLTASAPEKMASYAALVDWPTIATLAGLLVLTKGIELSGYLALLGKRLIALMPTTRTLALFLVLATALLSMLLTNDVALFVAVPLTIGLSDTASLPISRLVVFEALAANTGSTLTPISNPQNLFLWHRSGIPFHQYVASMLPLAAVLMATLLLFTAFCFPGYKLATRRQPPEPPADNSLLLLSLALYIPFLILADWHHALPAFMFVLGIFLLRHREVLARVDWLLLLVFMLMFIDLRLLAQLPLIHSWIDSANLANPRHMYVSGIVILQLISNVPAAILLAEYTSDWKLIAYAANVGGTGFMLGSLANIIALRIARDRKAWLGFHAFSIPFMLVAGGTVYLCLFALHLIAA